ncbi:hypothetical protein AMTR_s00046p00064600 [Amborella trichopoda]|uniref:Uncharacterized protein n=1 Tax=Amborella trichopoda TaxID=13333 RepID=U5CX85_AMBTC|nr:hypothetical protein AMTR_s00046p00064600 [Amborella trichopoda]
MDEAFDLAKVAPHLMSEYRIEGGICRFKKGAGNQTAQGLWVTSGAGPKEMQVALGDDVEEIQPAEIWSEGGGQLMREEYGEGGLPDYHWGKDHGT